MLPCARSFEDGLRLVKLRGEVMQAAADAQPSGMVSVIGLDSAKVAELCAVRPRGGAAALRWAATQEWVSSSVGA